MSVHLEPCTEADAYLTERLETDPVVMRELGGPHELAEIPAIHIRRTQSKGGSDWWLKIVPEGETDGVGFIGVWVARWAGESVHEVGWMILPERQGEGIASGALALLIERTRADERFEDLHAWPGVTNAPSNSLCRGAGFELLGPAEVTYRGRPLQVNHWVLHEGSSTPVPRS